MSPSCPVTIAPGMRKVRNPRIQYKKAATPAPGITPALLIKRTIATKMAIMSNVFKTLGRMPPAMRSERKTSPPPLSAVVAIELNLLKNTVALCATDTRIHIHKTTNENTVQRSKTNEECQKHLLESKGMKGHLLSV